MRMLNGSFSPGLEITTGNYFTGQGLAVTEVGPADSAYDRTVVVLFSAKTVYIEIPAGFIWVSIRVRRF